jgi:hypothetical protein
MMMGLCKGQTVRHLLSGASGKTYSGSLGSTLIDTFSYNFVKSTSKFTFTTFFGLKNAATYPPSNTVNPQTIVRISNKAITSWNMNDVDSNLLKITVLNRKLRI